MIIRNIFTKKSIWLSLSILVFLLFLSFSLYQIKDDIENITPTTLFDKDGKIISINREKRITWQETSDFTKDYLEQKSNQLPDILYSQNPIKKIIASCYIQIFYNKTERKEYYLNHLYFQNGVLGFSNAANYYFNKPVQQLTTLEEIFLFSKTKNYSPDTEKNLNIFTDNMVNDKLIASDELMKDKNEISSLLNSLYNKNTYSQSYLQYVLEEFSKQSGLSDEEIARNGFSIHTNLDSNAQLLLFESLRETGIYSKSQLATSLESGMVLIDHHSGEINAMMGGRNFQSSSLNRAYQIKRQPASTFKPLIVYAPALELGWKEEDTLVDSPMQFGTFTPHNFDFKYRKEVTLKDAFIRSYNVPTVWLLNEIGFKNGFNYIHKFGLFDVKKTMGLQLALGFTDKYGTNPLALAQAYSSFANNGVMIDAHAISNIKDVEGKTIYTAEKQPKRVYKKETAEKTKKLLISTVKEGTAKKASIKTQTIAGKTGTTSYDAWFVGFNDQYVSAVWIGPDEVHSLNQMDIGGGAGPAMLFNKVFEKLD